MKTWWCSLLAAAALCLVLPACGEESGPDDPQPGAAKVTTPPDLTGKADGSVDVRRVGTLRATETVEVDIEGAASWRFNAFPGTKVRIEASSEDLDPILTVRGPIPDTPNKVAVFNDDVSEDSFDAAVELESDTFGAYEIVLGSYAYFHQGKPGAGRMELRFVCLAQCNQPEVSLAEFFAAVDAEQLGFALQATLPTLFGDAQTAELVGTQLEAYLDGTSDGPFPVLPMNALATGQALLEEPSEELPDPQPVEFDIAALLAKGCQPERSALAPVHQQLPPELTRGWLPDYTIDNCTLQHTQDFAEVLNNLALENGSAVLNGETRYETIEAVFRALVEAGHHVRIENNRYLANFLGLNLNGASVAAPVWIDTGIAGADGNVVFPAPHTHHTIMVEGPLLNSRLTFYMGTSGGASFRADASIRPDWAGERTLYSYDSDTDLETIIDIVVTAGKLRKVWTERGAGMPLGGYGLLGVCNDSTAVLEWAAEQTVTIFPLVQPGVAGEPATEVDELLAELPSDLSAFDEADAIERLRLTMPYEDGLITPLTEQLVGK